MEAQAAFVWTDGAAELDPETAVHMINSFVVFPRNAEHDHAFGFDNAFKHALFFQHRTGFDHRFQGFQHLFSGLQELRLVGIALMHTFKDSLDIAHFCLLSRSSRPFFGIT